jgi:hypothetical protein
MNKGVVMKRNIYMMIAIFALALTFGCFDSSGTDNSGTAVTMPTMIMMQAVGATNAAFGESKSAKKAIVNTTINHTGNNFTAVGSYSYNDVAPHLPVTADITITWNGYTYGDVILKSGSARLQETASITYDIAIAYTGNFVVIYQGVTHTLTWDISASKNGASFTYSGDFTFDGQVYDCDFSMN